MNYYAISNIPGYNFLGYNKVNKTSLNNNNIAFQSNKLLNTDLSLYGRYIPSMHSFAGDKIRGNELNVLA